MDLRRELATIGVRRLWVLISGLPPDSAFARHGRGWTQSHELAAVAIERQEHWGSMLVQMSGRALKDNAKPPPGIQITHPDRVTPEPVKKKPASVDEIARMFAGR